MALSEADIRRANQRGAGTVKRGPLVKTATYEPATRTLALTFTNRTTMATPVDNIQGLAGVTNDLDLSVVEITSLGLGLHWPRLDVDIWIPALVEGVTGTRAWMSRQGGSSKSKAKVDAARRNGQKGGRPKKIEA
jgi:hypothetical protein